MDGETCLGGVASRVWLKLLVMHGRLWCSCRLAGCLELGICFTDATLALRILKTCLCILEADLIDSY